MTTRRVPPAESIRDQEVEERIKRFFERNYEILQQEGGHALAVGAKRQALDQALLYWRKLRSLAAAVTETEVKLALPGLVTPKGRPFVLEGVVDIVEDGDEVRMYDLKTHEELEVRSDPELYRDQMNVYAHIWRGIRGRSPDVAAIIATRLPEEVRLALDGADDDALDEALERWNPVVELPCDERAVARTIGDFGRCVDAIEDGEFAAPPVEALGQAHGKRRRRSYSRARPRRETSELTFAQVQCRNCDARFGCRSYLEHQRAVRTAARGSKQTLSADDELNAWIDANVGDNEDE